MAYQCLDCSYQSGKPFPGGKCPACDSYNIQKPQGKDNEQPKHKDKKTLVEIFTLILVWGMLIYGVWDRYLK